MSLEIIEQIIPPILIIIAILWYTMKIISPAEGTSITGNSDDFSMRIELINLG